MSLIAKVEQVDENHKRQHVCSTPKFGYGLYTLQSEGEELTGYYLVNAGAEQVGAELSKGQDLVRWSGYRTRITFLYFIYPIYILNFFSFLTTSFPGIHALSYEGFAGAEVVTVGLSMTKKNFFTLFKLSLSLSLALLYPENPKNKTVVGIYVFIRRLVLKLVSPFVLNVTQLE